MDANKILSLCEFSEHSQREIFTIKKIYKEAGYSFIVKIESNDPSSNNAFIEFERHQILRVLKMLETLVEY